MRDRPHLRADDTAISDGVCPHERGWGDLSFWIHGSRPGIYRDQVCKEHFQTARHCAVWWEGNCSRYGLNLNLKAEIS